MTDEIEKPKQKRGFALLSEEERKRISGKGGRAAHEAGTAHQFTHDEAVEAGKRGGSATAEKYGSEGMAEWGRKGKGSVHKKKE